MKIAETYINNSPIPVQLNRGREEMVFDNHHPNGVPYEEWKRNLVFDSKIRSGVEFDESGYSF